MPAFAETGLFGVYESVVQRPMRNMNELHLMTLFVHFEQCVVCIWNKCEVVFGISSHFLQVRQCLSGYDWDYRNNEG